MQRPIRRRTLRACAARAGAAAAVSPRFAAACLSVAMLACGIGDSGPARNVVVIVLDTTRADHLGVYDPTRTTTPRLDALASEATVFDFAIAQASVTPVSCASILTGRWPYRHGLRTLHGTSQNRLPPAQVTLAEVWHRAGGRSAAFVSAFPASRAFGLAQGFDVFDADFGIENAPKISKTGVVSTGRSQRAPTSRRTPHSSGSRARDATARSCCGSTTSTPMTAT